MTTASSQEQVKAAIKEVTLNVKNVSGELYRIMKLLSEKMDAHLKELHNQNKQASQFSIRGKKEPEPNKHNTPRLK